MTLTAGVPMRIVLIHHGRYEEANASGICAPGDLIMKDTADKVLRQNVRGGNVERLVAIEDALRGCDPSIGPHNVFDAYAVGDVIPHVIALPGSELNVNLTFGTPAGTVVIGTGLMSMGDGTFGAVPVATKVLSDTVADSTAITNVNTETAFSQTCVIPANELQVGDQLRILVAANVVAQHSTDTLTLKLKIGTTVIVATAAVDVATADEGLVECLLTIRTIGASGTLVAGGVEALGTPGTATARDFELLSTAVDTTAAQTLSVTATWSVADPGNQVVLTQFSVELLRASGFTVLATARAVVDNSAGSATVKLAARFL